METWEKLVTIGTVIVLAGIATTYNKQQELWITLTQAVIGLAGLGWLVYASKYLKKKALEDKAMFKKTEETKELVGNKMFDLGTSEDFIVGAQERIRELREHLDNETKVFESRYTEISELKGAIAEQVGIMRKLWGHLEREEAVVKGILKIRQVRQ